MIMLRAYGCPILGPLAANRLPQAPWGCTDLRRVRIGLMCLKAMECVRDLWPQSIASRVTYFRQLRLTGMCG